MALDLHDGIGQTVAGLIVSLVVLRRQHSSSLTTPGLQLLDECLAVAKLCSRQLRTVSYLHHPPLLEGGGLKLTLRQVVREFSRRSMIQTNLDLPRTPVQLSSEMELAILRTVRECLLNVHRHSGSRRADVSLRVTPAKVRLDVRDRGRGFPPDVQGDDPKRSMRFGVGLMGVAERVRKLGGVLSVRSDGKGATLSAVMPRDGRRQR